MKGEQDEDIFDHRCWYGKTSESGLCPVSYTHLAIIDDIKQGIGKTDGKYVEICDRKEAIRYAIEHGQPGDVIVLAGKGHEDYQEIEGVKHPMDERVLIQEVLEELGK